MSDLGKLYQMMCELTDPVAAATRNVRIFKHQADQLEEYALASGAMRRDIEVVGTFASGAGGFWLKPELR